LKPEGAKRRGCYDRCPIPKSCGPTKEADSGARENPAHLRDWFFLPEFGQTTDFARPRTNLIRTRLEIAEKIVFRSPRQGAQARRGNLDLLHLKRRRRPLFPFGGRKQQSTDWIGHRSACGGFRGLPAGSCFLSLDFCRACWLQWLWGLGE